ncbi:MAG: hypothetical protein ACI358_04995 [Candidatus Limimorpha sp.]
MSSGKNGLKHKVPVGCMDTLMEFFNMNSLFNMSGRNIGLLLEEALFSPPVVKENEYTALP